MLGKMRDNVNILTCYELLHVSYLYEFESWRFLCMCACMCACVFCGCTAATPPCSLGLLRGAIKQRIFFCEQLMRFCPKRRQLIGSDYGLRKVKGTGRSTALWEMMTLCTRRLESSSRMAVSKTANEY